MASWSSIQYNLLEDRHIEKWKIFMEKAILFSSNKLFKDFMANKAR